MSWTSQDIGSGPARIDAARNRDQTYRRSLSQTICRQIDRRAVTRRCRLTRPDDAIPGINRTEAEIALPDDVIDLWQRLPCSGRAAFSEKRSFPVVVRYCALLEILPMRASVGTTSPRDRR